MPDDTTIVFGIPLPSVDPLFLAAVRFHILVGIICVVAGIVAMLSQKRRGRHSTFGMIYYWCLAVVVASATGLSVARWTENYHLAFLGALSFIAATMARTALRQRWRNRLRVHIASMGLSYILMLTAFYVDNGKNLPLWRELPQWGFWVLPICLGAPIIIYVMLRHPLLRQAAAR
jgi:peptidoglycan/LPS O-acetylase OafA/YrhL